MRSARPLLSLLAGVLLGLGVVALPLVAAGGPAGSPGTPSTNGAEVTSAGEVVTHSPTNSTASVAVAPLFALGSEAGSPSSIAAIAKQPAGTTAFTFLPLVAALALGLAAYRVSRRRVGRKSGPD
jgi:hypothetical protein